MKNKEMNLFCHFISKSAYFVGVTARVRTCNCHLLKRYPLPIQKLEPYWHPPCKRGLGSGLELSGHRTIRTAHPQLEDQSD